MNPKIEQLRYFLNSKIIRLYLFGCVITFICLNIFEVYYNPLLYFANNVKCEAFISIYILYIITSILWPMILFMIIKEHSQKIYYRISNDALYNLLFNFLIILSIGSFVAMYLFRKRNIK